MNEQLEAQQEQDLGGESSRGIARIGSPDPAEISVQTAIKVIVNLGDVSPRDTSETTIPQMFDAGLAETLNLEIVSTLDQAADVQIIGATSNVPEEPTRHYRIGNSITLPAGGRTAATIDLRTSWMPFIGVTITPVTSPTAGQVVTRAYSIRRVEK